MNKYEQRLQRNINELHYPLKLSTTDDTNMHRSNLSIGSLGVLIRCACRFRTNIGFMGWKNVLDILEMGSTIWGITPLYDMVMLFD